MDSDFRSRPGRLRGFSINRLIPNVLTLGEQPPRYNVNVLSLSLRYSY